MKRADFWTSTEYSGFLSGLVRELEEHGYASGQCFHISEASYRGAKSRLGRLWLRFRQYVSYPLALVGRLIFSGRSGVVVITTNTFYAPLIATLVHPRVVHLVYDLYPDAMIHAGKWREGSLKAKVVRRLIGLTMRRCVCNVFLGERLKQHAERFHGDSLPEEKTCVISVGADQGLFPNAPTPMAEDAVPEILYCGNFGNMHDEATLFAWWESVREAVVPVRFRFHCSGPKLALLKRQVGTLSERWRSQVAIEGGLEQAAWVVALSRSPVALVTMVNGSESVVMPSKTYSAMMAGQAILAIAPEDSDLVDLIKASDGGWWVAPGDVAGLDGVIRAMSEDASLLNRKRQHAYQYAHAYFGQDVLSRAWTDLFRGLITSGLTRRTE